MNLLALAYLTQRQQIKHLSKKEYLALRELCSLAKNMYNVALYNIRQHFFNTGKYLNYYDNYHLAKENENYKLLNSNMAQQIIKEADSSFKSFFELLKLKKAGKYDAKVKIPKYLPKNEYFSLIIGQIRIKDNGALDIPVSREFKKLNRKTSITIKVPSNLKGKKIKEIRIIPKYNARFFEIQYTYETELKGIQLNIDNVLAIDFGVDNLATCVTNSGKAFIIDGKRLKSLNQWYNKQYSKCQALRDKLLGANRPLTKKEIQLIEKRNNRFRDYLNKSARLIINYCINNDIGTLIVGRNKQMKKKAHMGKANNQTFVQIPISELMNKLKYLCEYNGINYVEQEESYTSRADFFSNDYIPIFDKKDTTRYTFSGKRITRGQYKSATGMVLNADTNGALNIMLKSRLGGSKLTILQSRGNLDMPVRIRIS